MPVQSWRPLAVLLRATRQSATFRGGLALRLGLPVLMVGTALLVADGLRSVFPGAGLFLLLLVPVLLASMWLGALAGSVALAGGTGGACLMVAVRAHPWLQEPSHMLRVVPFLFLGSFIVLISSVLRASLRRSTPPQARISILIEPLTDREAEVLGLAAGGLSTDAIADHLFLSRNTVKSHLAHAYGKLGAHNRMEAVAAAVHVHAIDGGLLTLQAPRITESAIAPGVPVRSRPRVEGVEP